MKEPFFYSYRSASFAFKRLIWIFSCTFGSVSDADCKVQNVWGSWQLTRHCKHDLELCPHLPLCLVAVSHKYMDTSSTGSVLGDQQVLCALAHKVSFSYWWVVVRGKRSIEVKIDSSYTFFSCFSKSSNMLRSPHTHQNHICDVGIHHVCVWAMHLH